MKSGSVPSHKESPSQVNSGQSEYNTYSLSLSGSGRLCTFCLNLIFKMFLRTQSLAKCCKGGTLILIVSVYSVRLLCSVSIRWGWLYPLLSYTAFWNKICLTAMKCHHLQYLSHELILNTRHSICQCTPVHNSAHHRTPVHTSAHRYTPMHTSAHQYTPMHTSTYQCTGVLVCTCAYWCVLHTLVCTGVLWRALACTGVFWCALVCTGVHWRALVCTYVYWCQLVWTGVHWCVLVCTGMHWCALACTCMYWCALASTGVYLLCTGSVLACGLWCINNYPINSQSETWLMVKKIIWPKMVLSRRVCITLPFHVEQYTFLIVLLQARHWHIVG